MKSKQRFEYQMISTSYPITGMILDNMSPKYKANEMLYLTWSPTSNCQTFSIGFIQELVARKYDKDQILTIFKLIFGAIHKHQMIIDVEELYLKSILKVLRPLITKKYCKKYTSTNGSKMNLVIIQLDKDKLQ